MAGRFARGFQYCLHHRTGDGVHGEGPMVVESHCLLAAGARRPVRCVGVADALSQSKSKAFFRLTPQTIYLIQERGSVNWWGGVTTRQNEHCLVDYHMGPTVYHTKPSVVHHTIHNRHWRNYLTLIQNMIH